MKNLSLLVAIICCLSSCANRFSNTVYKDKTIDNKTLAVLPYEVITTGRIPKEITDEMLAEIEVAESKAFQISLYHQILRRLDRKRHRHLNIKVQAYQETNRKLSAANVDLKESIELSAEELANILGVDAVIRSNVHKNRYLTDLESYGIHIARQILWHFTNVPFWLPSGKTSDVRISTTIIDTSDGNALWSASRRCPTDWNTNTYDAIERINNSISRRLPR